MDDQKTIVALATPPGVGALAILRISGKDAHVLFAICLGSKGSLFLKATTNTIHLYSIYHPTTKNCIDEITAIKYCSPRSFSGEDMVEVICHGGKLVPLAILETLVFVGMRFAGKGEFTRRAFLNGKLDILKAESIHGLIEAHTPLQHKIALEMYHGGSAKKIMQWKQEIVSALSLLESGLEFPEETPNPEQFNSILEKLSVLKTDIEAELCIRDRLKTLEKGLTIVLFGPKNAGKSTIFNILVGGDRSIVHETEGTTRDLVSESLEIENSLVCLIDTAGIGNSDNPVEQIGIDRSWDVCSHAHLVLWITPANQPFIANETDILNKGVAGKIWSVINKIDLSTDSNKELFFKNNNIPILSISSFDSESREQLICYVGSWVKENYLDCMDHSVMLNSRHEDLGTRLVESLTYADSVAQFGEDVYAQSITKALLLFDEFFGRTTSEEVINEIFSKFCIGK